MTLLEASAEPEGVQQWRAESVTCQFIFMTKGVGEIIFKTGATNATRVRQQSYNNKLKEITETIIRSISIGRFVVYYMNVRESLVKFLKTSGLYHAKQTGDFKHTF